MSLFFKCGNAHFRSYTGFKALNWASRPSTEDLQALFGVGFAPCLRTVQLWIGAIKYGSFSVWKNMSSRRPCLVWVPEMTSKVEIVVAICPRIAVRELARKLDTNFGSIHRILNRFCNIKKDKMAFMNLLFPMDNARAHSEERTRAYLEQRGVQIDPQSPYSPDLNLCDRFLFTRLQQYCRAIA